MNSRAFSSSITGERDLQKNWPRRFEKHLIRQKAPCDEAFRSSPLLQEWFICGFVAIHLLFCFPTSENLLTGFSKIESAFTTSTRNHLPSEVSQTQDLWVTF